MSQLRPNSIINSWVSSYLAHTLDFFAWMTNPMIKEQEFLFFDIGLPYFFYLFHYLH